MSFVHLKPYHRFGIAWMLVAVAIVGRTSAVESARPVSSTDSTKPIVETRFVKFEKASIYCGPSKDHYVTNILIRGASVEIHHQTKDGWCGIRPPDGSHDWIAADQAYLLPGGKQAEVIGDKTPAWIGTDTNVKDQRFRWQIELQATQKVDVIGEIKQAIDTEKARLWYKILPPPGEFRWIQTEALSSTLPKSRSTTVTLADAQSSIPIDHDQTQQAHYNSNSRKSSSPSSLLVRQAMANQLASDQVVEQLPMMNGDSLPLSSGRIIEREPVAGEYIAGEGIVIGSRPGEMRVDEGYAGSIPDEWNSNDGYINDEGYVIDHSIDGGQVIEGTIIDGDDQPCPTCNRRGCTTCDATHQTDSFQQWDAVEAIGNPKLRFRPIGRILGLIGLSVVEGERVQDIPGSRCSIGCGCVRCTQNRADLHPRSSGRFDHLPRPSRRLPGQDPNDWLGMNTSIQDTLTQYDPVNDRGNRDSAEPTNASKNWHGIASARLGSNLGNVGANPNSQLNNQSLLGTDRSSVLTASAQGEELHFTTPEIQQAMIDLSRAVSESMERWSLREHAARAQSWIEQAADPIARGEARLLMERIESFEQLRRRSQNTTETAYATSTPNGYASSYSAPASLAGFQRPLATASQPTSINEPFPASPAGTQRNPDGTPASDASGWLVQVHSAEFGQPEYALTDDFGGLIAYVQPSPGMNLGRYLKQPVGIYGVKGYLPNLSARQIIVERIVRLR